MGDGGVNYEGAGEGWGQLLGAGKKLCLIYAWALEMPIRGAEYGKHDILGGPPITRGLYSKIYHMCLKQCGGAQCIKKHCNDPFTCALYFILFSIFLCYFLLIFSIIQEYE
jgi:hypothetical protein